MKLIAPAIMLLCLGFNTATADQTLPAGPPGSIRLLEGYQHERLQGIDTLVGRIWKPDGPELRYDIGDLAGNHAQSTKMRRWSKRQTIAGHAFTLTMRTDDVLLLTFDQGCANFIVQGIHNDEDLAEVLLMLLSY